jgi:hypothetical protein
MFSLFSIYVNEKCMVDSKSEGCISCQVKECLQWGISVVI